MGMKRLIRKMPPIEWRLSESITGGWKQAVTEP
jgi:hypothetical protein